MTNVWGVHMPAEVGNGPVEDNAVSIGWSGMGDIFALPKTREAFKERLAQAYPNTKAGAIPVDAAHSTNLPTKSRPATSSFIRPSTTGW